jgi:hypothetical protein
MVIELPAFYGPWIEFKRICFLFLDEFPAAAGATDDFQHAAVSAGIITHKKTRTIIIRAMATVLHGCDYLIQATVSTRGNHTGKQRDHDANQNFTHRKPPRFEFKKSLIPHNAPTGTVDGHGARGIITIPRL